MLTGKILSQIYPDDKIRTEGFEEIEYRFNNHFDVVSSNIPFGDVAASDIAYLKSADKVKRQASRSIHNYFFLKGVDVLKDGGVLALGAKNKNSFIDSNSNSMKVSMWEKLF
nr:hypothetical protein [uncultured Draconibacterium sp.]